MKCIVGLGNPGKDYEATRHNVGCMVVDALRETLTNQPRFKVQAKFNALFIQQGEVVLLKPQTYMNLSGKAVVSVLNYFKLDPATDLLVVHDDLDIAFGEHKLQFATGPKMHNGVASVEQYLGTKDFWRLRVGIDAPSRTPNNVKIPGEAYVLQPFSIDECSHLKSLFVKLNQIIRDEWLA
jgi:PTH1 family peptidyl-tRNA hydrolase